MVWIGAEPQEDRAVQVSAESQETDLISLSYFLVYRAGPHTPEVSLPHPHRKLPMRGQEVVKHYIIIY